MNSLSIINPEYLKKQYTILRKCKIFNESITKQGKVIKKKSY